MPYRAYRSLIKTAINQSRLLEEIRLIGLIRVWVKKGKTYESVAVW